jgi:hypothetical protein
MKEDWNEVKQFVHSGVRGMAVPIGRDKRRARK